MRILVALGGNALLRGGEAAEASAQQRNVEVAAGVLASIAAEHEVVLTQGDGSQVGLLEVALRNVLPDRDVVTVLTEVVVSADDPAFATPSKPTGPIYSDEEARQRVAERDWSVGEDGDGFRRLMPSPEPHAIAEMRSLRMLIDAGVLVICAGGGGIPIVIDGAGSLREVEAVIDKDLTAALLARRLDADLLLMLTDVDAVHMNWGTDTERALDWASPTELRQADFAPGSIGPKVEAARRFVEATDRRAAIGELKDAVAMVRGEAGTQIGSRPF
jgi:carbamate kinase